MGRLLVVLLEVNTQRVAILELERDTPRTVDVDRIPGRAMAMKGMKIESGNIHVRGSSGPIKSVEMP
jgi:hypothetical protein